MKRELALVLVAFLAYKWGRFTAEAGEEALINHYERKNELLELKAETFDYVNENRPATVEEFKRGLDERIEFINIIQNQ